jgi:thiol-disulfide isomerase/thioredoxin
MYEDDSIGNIKPSLDGAKTWLNSRPLSLDILQKKVVLIYFWTYTCIDCRRALPYIRAWASKYKEQGLVVIGVHTPEFSFEHTRENVNREISTMDISFPVAMDNDLKIWNSFRNQYWPAIYLMDTQGQIRYQKSNEGGYGESECKIQELLKEVSPKRISDKLVDLHPAGFELQADRKNLKSFENYIGLERRKSFVSPEQDDRGLFYLPDDLQLNQWGLSGAWEFANEHAQLKRGSGILTYHFHARDLHLIMGAGIPETSIKFQVLIDGFLPGSLHGLDTDSDGIGLVRERRMYQLVRQREVVSDHKFQIEFFDPGVEIFDLSFG